MYIYCVIHISCVKYNLENIQDNFLGNVPPYIAPPVVSKHKKL